VVVVRDRRRHVLGRKRTGSLSGTRTVTVRLKRGVAARVVATGRGSDGHQLRATAIARR
jgi:hypothetical protein